jgi:hypothetical protein
MSSVHPHHVLHPKILGSLLQSLAKDMNAGEIVCHVIAEHIQQGEERAASGVEKPAAAERGVRDIQDIGLHQQAKWKHKGE